MLHVIFILSFAQPDVYYTECSVCSPDVCEKTQAVTRVELEPTTSCFLVQTACWMAQSVFLRFIMLISRLHYVLELEFSKIGPYILFN